MIETGKEDLEENINSQAHKSLLEGINRLRKTQHIKQPTRNESTLIQDEFHLTRNSSDTSVTIDDLVKVLKRSNKHLNVAKDLKKTHFPKKVLQKPLEKPEAEKIQRTIGYEKIKRNLSRWDAAVAKNRSVEQQIFPLENETVYINTGALKKPPSRSVKSELMIEMEAIESQLNSFKMKKGNNNNSDEDNENEKKIQEKLTKNELMARRKEISYLRMRESQKSAKARMKNKIKSKKYHKLLKREKLKEQMKEFEILQKTNPKLALEKLDKLEKTRVQERASLRHKNTGTWAKNLQVRAKYDKDARKDLAEQLALSRELTQKQKEEDDESCEDSNSNENEEKANESDYDPFNPWTTVKGKVSQADEITNFVSGYRKYWMERNKNEEDRKNYENNDNFENSNEKLTDEIVESKNDENEVKKERNENIANQELSVNKKSKKTLKSDFKKGKKQKENKTKIEDGWLVEEIQSNKNYGNLENIDVIFDGAENILEQKISEKLDSLSKSLKSSNSNVVHRRAHHKDELKQLKDLSFKEQANKPELDEELLETSNVNVNENVENSKCNNSKFNESSIEQIDPNKYTQIKPKLLRTSLPDAVNLDAFIDENSGDNNENSKNMTIVEAFEDDDIVVDFEKEREDEQRKNATEEIDLSLPGWGTWAGHGISKEKQSKRFILKLSKEQPKLNNKKENVYVNEETSKKLKEHLVSNLPFPFTAVKDYEASIRAPIGRSFVPETAFRMLTRPSVITKKGHIITPMDESILLKPPKRPRTVVDKRIENLNKK